MTVAVYPVRPGDDNPELRYSLRSLEANLPMVTDVFIVGHKPTWLNHRVQVIPGGNPTGSAPVNVWTNIMLAAQHPDLPWDILMMNDDFFITQEIDSIPVMYRGPLDAHILSPQVQSQRGSWWHESLTATLICLQATRTPNIRSYELHIPFTVDRQDMACTLAKYDMVSTHCPPQWRTLYGNENRIGGTPADADVKAYGPGPITRPFLSTHDKSFRYFEGELERMFPRKSRWEA